MKKRVLTLLTLLTTMGAMAQGNTDEPIAQNCYQKYAAIFEERGAFDVEDGLYEDVVVTIRKGESAECFYGRVRVTEGNMSRIQIKFEDGTYTDLEKKYKHSTPIKVKNGMSEPRVTINDEVITVLFVQKIKPKKKEFAKAPDPSDMDF